MARDIGADCYCETSALTQYGVELAFENVIRAALLEKSKSRFSSTNLKHICPPICQLPALPPPNRTPDVVSIATTLKTDFGDLLRHKYFTDVVIIIRDHEINAHKFVLSSCSSVLLDLFSMDLTAQAQAALTDDVSIASTSTESVCLLPVARQQSMWIELKDELFSAIGIVIKKSKPITALLVRTETGIAASEFERIVEFMYIADLDILQTTTGHGDQVVQTTDTGNQVEVQYALARTLCMDRLSEALRLAESVEREARVRLFLRERMINFSDLMLDKALFSGEVQRARFIQK